MILGVNGIRLVRERSGVARVLEAVLNAFAQIEQPFDEIRLYSPEPIDAGVRLPPLVRRVVVPSRLPAGLWEQLVLPRAHGRRDVLLCPSYVVPLLARCPMLLVHHGSYEGYPRANELFPWWTRAKYRISYPLSAHRATAVSTVSEYSRRDMARFYRLPPERIQVIPNGVDLRQFHPRSDEAALAAWRRRTLGADAPFLLYVGKPTFRRNLPNLLRAFAMLKRAHGVPHKMMLIGTALPGTSFAALVQELDIAREVITVPHAPHEEIAWAYNASSALVYPSSYEGFGMPVLEAMACGTPVIALDNTAFPEVAGGVALLLPDAEVTTLVEGILRVLSDDALRARMATDGPRRATEFAWPIIARRYASLLASIARG